AGVKSAEIHVRLIGLFEPALALAALGQEAEKVRLTLALFLGVVRLAQGLVLVDQSGIRRLSGTEIDLKHFRQRFVQLLTGLGNQVGRRIVLQGSVQILECAGPVAAIQAQLAALDESDRIIWVLLDTLIDQSELGL